MLLRFFRGNAPGTERTRRPLLRRNILKRKRYLASDYLFMSPSTGAQRRGCKFPAAFSLSLTRRVIPGDYFQTSTFQTAAHRRNSRFGRRRRGTEEEYKGRWVRDHFLSKEAIKFVIRTGARLTSFVPRQKVYEPSGIYLATESFSTSSGSNPSSSSFSADDDSGSRSWLL